MGLEYAQGILVADLSWRPTWGSDAPAILDADRELIDRGLVRELERAFETSLVDLGWIY